MFEKDEDLRSSQQAALLHDLAEYVYAELKSAGLGRKGDIVVCFNFESAERLDSGSTASTIPSDEALAHAEKLDDERSRHLEKVGEAIKRHFISICPLHDVWILPQGDVTFRVYVFFAEDKDIRACKDRGIVQNLIDFAYDELERAGRGKRGEITVGFEFDSHENVLVNYDGNYFLRLR